MSTDCDAGVCETGVSGQGRGGGCGSSGSGCPCGTPGCSADPMECALGMWSCAFFQAMKEVQVEFLKGKIQKAWGAKMEKTADVVLEAMGVQWQSTLAQAQAKETLRERLQGLWREGK